VIYQGLCKDSIVSTCIGQKSRAMEIGVGIGIGVPDAETSIYPGTDLSHT